MNRTTKIALGMFAVVVGVVAYFAQEKPMDESQTRAYEARCMASYDAWMTKKPVSLRELTECEKHFADKGNSIQAQFFASARRGRGS